MPFCIIVACGNIGTPRADIILELVCILLGALAVGQVVCTASTGTFLGFGHKVFHIVAAH